MYKILEIKDNKELFKEILENYLVELRDNVEDYYYSNGTYYEKINENIDIVKNDVFIIDENNNFIDLITRDKYYGLDIIYTSLESSKFDMLYDYFPSAIISIDYIDDMPNNYQIANMKSTLNNEEYQVFGPCTFLIPKTLDVNIIRDKIEEELFVELDKSQITFENKKGEELQDDIFKYYQHNPFFKGITCDSSNHSHIAGFHYFNLDMDAKKDFLVCKQGNTYLGVIKYGIYDNYGSVKHQGLPYIDVNQKYQQNGIATLMIQQLNKYLDKDIPLFLTRESDQGKLCHMENLFLKYINTTICVPYEKQTEYYNSLQNGTLDEFKKSLKPFTINDDLER